VGGVEFGKNKKWCQKRSTGDVANMKDEKASKMQACLLGLNFRLRIRPLHLCLFTQQMQRLISSTASNASIEMTPHLFGIKTS